MNDVKKDLRIVFMGTPDFAVASLQAILEAGMNVIAVITAPDKPGGRGMELQQSDVKKFALENALPVLQPVKLKDPHFLETLQQLKADVQVVVAFRMLPEIVWAMPAYGTINLHGSLLPQFRGAAPINRAIMAGETETGVTTFLLQQQIDTGNIILQEKINIRKDETAGELYEEMKVIGAQLLVKTLHKLSTGGLEAKPQENLVINAGELKHAPKLFTEDCEINWQNKVDHIYNQVRGLSPYPAAFTSLKGKKLKFFRAEKEFLHTGSAPGKIETDGKTFLKFACQDGYIHATEIQLEGKKKMAISDFLRGYRHKE